MVCLGTVMKVFSPREWGDKSKQDSGNVDLNDQPDRQELLEAGMAKGEGPEVSIKGFTGLGESETQR